jgi:AcrR family transcriptional regulator
MSGSRSAGTKRACPELMTAESSSDAATGRPPRRRRKQARSAEITAAALEIFANHGFAAARLDDIARRAGVVKGSIYRYFPTKEELFRAVVRSAIVPNLESVRGAAEGFDESYAELAPKLLMGAAAVLSRPLIARFVRLVIGESRNFPDVARIWHDEVVAPVIAAMTGAIARAQARGEAKAGDPRLYAYSFVGPLFTALLYREVFGEATNDLPDLGRIAEQHSRVLLRGLLAAPPT